MSTVYATRIAAERERGIFSAMRRLCAVGLLLPLLSGCPSETFVTAEATSTGTPCQSPTGTLEGTVYLFMIGGQKAPRALVSLRRTPQDTPLHAMADDAGDYSVPIEPGDWIVGGDTETGDCTTFMPATVTIVACETTPHDVVLEACVN
jgi:hypothetical protein